MTDRPKRAATLACATLAAALTLLPLPARAEEPRLVLADGSAAPASTARTLGGAPSLGAPLGSFAFGGLLGLDIPPSGYTIGVRISGELMYGVLDLAPDLRLDLGGRIALHFGGLDTNGIPDLSTSSFAIDFVPDVKLAYALAPAVAIYGDFGLGLAYLRNSASRGTVSQSSDTMAFAIQFGAGAAYAVSSSVNLLGEIRFNVYTASGSGTFIAFPQVGVQFH